MLEIDNELTRRGVPIPGRQIAALLEAKYDENVLEGSILFPPRAPRPGVYRGDDLAIRVSAWYERTYGDRLMIDQGPGSSVLMLRGEIWEYHLPRGMGPAVIYARDLETGPAYQLHGHASGWLPPGAAARRTSGVPTYDALAGVVGLPASVIPHLSEAELRDVVTMFAVDWPALVWLNRARYHSLAFSALGDYRAAVRHLVARPPDLGLARWASLQALEKMLKSCLAHTTGKYPTRGRDAHDLLRLGELVHQSIGLKLRPETLAIVACKPGVRYGEEAPGAPAEVVSAAQVALCIGGFLAAFLCQQRPLPDTPRYLDDPDGVGATGDLVRMLFERSGVTPATPDSPT